jgi:hypothetical protein
MEERDLWMCEAGTVQHVAQLHDSYTMMMMMMMMMMAANVKVQNLSTLEVTCVL